MRKLLVIIPLVALLLALAACGQVPNFAQGEHSPAPAFAVEDLQGNQVVFEPGRPLVLTFWASSCPSCTRMMPDWQTVFNELDATDTVRMMSINVNDTRERAMQVLDRAGHTFPVYFDHLNETALAFRITHIPATFFINGNGDIVHTHIGTLNATMLRLYIDDLRD